MQITQKNLRCGDCKNLFRNRLLIRTRIFLNCNYIPKQGVVNISGSAKNVTVPALNTEGLLNIGKNVELVTVSVLASNEKVIYCSDKTKLFAPDEEERHAMLETLLLRRMLHQ